MTVLLGEIGVDLRVNSTWRIPPGFDFHWYGHGQNAFPSITKSDIGGNPIWSIDILTDQNGNPIAKVFGYGKIGATAEASLDAEKNLKWTEESSRVPWEIHMEAQRLLKAIYVV